MCVDRLTHTHVHTYTQTRVGGDPKKSCTRVRIYVCVCVHHNNNDEVALNLSGCYVVMLYADIVYVYVVNNLCPMYGFKVS